ncbi:MAG TPA: hypothetical protein VFE30_18950 [Anaeromyxobacteraceae bacterium]|jgi:hypothetical protein|nr:hypothetical protein [Anaeromyxobacteraceae bacterium]
MSVAVRGAAIGLTLALSACAGGAAGSGARAEAPGRDKSFPTERPNCASCHEPGQPRLKAEVVVVCRACHTSAHGTLLPTDPGAGMACNSCHDPHGVHGIGGVPRA